MKIIKILALVCFCLLLTLPTTLSLAQEPAPNIYEILTSTPQPDGSIYHIVQPGESLWAISVAYGIGSEIMVLNGNSPRRTRSTSTRCCSSAGQTPRPRPATPPQPPSPPLRTADRVRPKSNAHPDQNAPPNRHPDPAAFTAQVLFGDSKKVGWTMVACSGVGLCCLCLAF